MLPLPPPLSRPPPLTRAAALLVQGLLLSFSWALFSYSTSAIVLGEQLTLPPFRAMGWGLGGVLLLAALLPRLARTRGRRESDGRRLAFLAGAGTAILALGLDREAALPAIAALWLATGWIAADGPAQTARLLASLPGLRALILFVLVAELLLQLAAAWTTHSTRPIQADTEAEVRILCVGDSFTFGIGASGPEQTWPGVLERRLQERLPDRRVKVWNCGVPAQNSSTLLLNLPDYLESWKPQLVIVCSGTNNRWNLRNVDLARHRDNPRGALWRSGMAQQLQRLRLLRLAQISRVRFADQVPELPPEETPQGHVFYWQRPSAVADATALRELAEQAPDGSNYWVELVRKHLAEREDEAALAVAREAVQRTTENAWIWQEMGVALSRLDRPEEAMQAFLEAIRQGRDPGRIYDFGLTAFRFDSARMMRYLDELQHRDPELFALLPKLGEGHFERETFYRVVWADLEEMLRLCRSHGAEMLLHTYPFHDPGLENCYAGFALTHELRLVFHWEYVRQAREREPEREFFVADGHCNDAGYALLAENLLPVVWSLLERRGLTR